jgi:hypothetical protein
VVDEAKDSMRRTHKGYVKNVQHTIGNSMLNYAQDMLTLNGPIIDEPEVDKGNTMTATA